MGDIYDLGLLKTPEKFSSKMEVLIGSCSRVFLGQFVSEVSFSSSAHHIGTTRFSMPAIFQSILIDLPKRC